MSSLASAFAAVAAVLVAPLAHADALPPNASGCAGKSAGAPCLMDDKSSGSCTAAKCSSINYSCDGGKSPCGTIERDCFLCTAGGSPAADAGTADGGAAGDGGASPVASSTNCSLGARDRSAPGVPFALLALGLGLFAGRRSRRA
jgi:hypothetical protein